MKLFPFLVAIVSLFVCFSPLALAQEEVQLESARLVEILCHELDSHEMSNKEFVSYLDSLDFTKDAKASNKYVTVYSKRFVPTEPDDLVLIKVVIGINVYQGGIVTRLVKISTKGKSTFRSAFIADLKRSGLAEVLNKSESMTLSGRRLFAEIKGNECFIGYYVDPNEVDVDSYTRRKE